MLSHTPALPYRTPFHSILYCRIYYNLLVVPPVKLSTYGRRAFSVSGPVVWNSLPDYLRDDTLSHDSFRRYLKTYLFAPY